MKTYKNSKGEDLPKEINEVVNAEHNRLGTVENGLNDSLKLWYAFHLGSSNYFKEDNFDNWCKVWNGDYLQFYLEYKFKNAKGQIFPDEIQNEIYEEIKRQKVERVSDWLYGFNFAHSHQGQRYWENLLDKTDYSQPTKSDDTFTQGEIVEVSYNNKTWYPCVFIAKYNEWNIAVEKGEDGRVDDVDMYLFIRKIQPLELTLPELLTIAESVKGIKVILKS